MENNHDGVWNRSEQAWNWYFLHTYNITMTLGILFSFLSIVYFWKKQKYSWETLQILLILIVPGSIIGARLWFLISEGGWTQWYVFQGLSIHGGVMGAFLAAGPFLYYRRHSIDVRTAIGIILPNIILGQAIGRWGNFANHEVYGRVVDGDSLNWMGAMKDHMKINGHYRQPMFFYEFITSSIGYIVIVWFMLRKNWFKPGVTAAIYLLWYGIVRTVMEPLRDPQEIMKLGSLPISLFISITMITLGIGLGVWFQFFSKKEYEVINPIKSRRLFLFGKVSDMKKQYLFWGKEVPNRIKIWLPVTESNWSKREIGKGKKNMVKQKADK